jgi:hypothetical protein
MRGFTESLDKIHDEVERGYAAYNTVLASEDFNSDGREQVLRVVSKLAQHRVEIHLVKGALKQAEDEILALATELTGVTFDVVSE